MLPKGNQHYKIVRCEASNMYMHISICLQKVVNINVIYAEGTWRKKINILQTMLCTLSSSSFCHLTVLDKISLGSYVYMVKDS